LEVNIFAERNIRFLTEISYFESRDIFSLEFRTDKKLRKNLDTHNRR